MRRRFLPGERDPAMLLPGSATGPLPRRTRVAVEPLSRGRAPSSSLTAHPKMPFAMVDASASTRRSVHVGPSPVHDRVVGCGQRGELREVTGETELAVVGQRDGARGQPRRATGQLRELARARLRARA